ncbi:Ammonia transport outward protein 2 [Spathaspora sp. JA1]|nr:Ammonia transport outward protein 2 [Spathaspora sp. JA1]
MIDTAISTSVPYRRCRCTKSNDRIVINELEVISETSTEIDSERVLITRLVCVDVVDPSKRVGSAEPLGLLSTGFNGIVIGLCLCLQIPMNVAVGLTLFYSGIVHFLCGIWEMYRGHTMNATGFTSIGAFWIQLGTINIPSFGTRAAYGGDDEMFYNAVGFMFLSFGFFELMMTSLSFKGSITGMLNPLTFAIAMFFNAAGHFTGYNQRYFVLAGIFSVINATIGFYDAFGQISTRHNSYFQFPNITIPDLFRNLMRVRVKHKNEFVKTKGIVVQ